MKDTRPSERYLLLIGNITAYWSVTELMCDQALSALLGVSLDQARHMSRAMAGRRARLDVLKNLSERVLANKETLHKFRTILEKLARASESRDRVVHSIWFNLGYEDRIRTRYRFKQGKQPIAGSTKFTLDELQAVLDQIKDATEALTSFLLNKLGMPPSLPGVTIDSMQD